MELFEFIKDFELTDAESVNKALEAFNAEYELLSGDPKTLRVNPWIVNKEELIDAGISLGINLLGELLGRAIPNLINPRAVWSGIKARLSNNSVSILQKIDQMLSPENASAFNSVNDYARIAAHVYGNRRDSIIPSAWKCLGHSYRNLKLDDEKSGLTAALYKKEGNRPKFIYAIAGTRGWDIKDWKANIGQLPGFSDQYDRAGEISEKLSKELGSENITMVGHSKGGGQAAYCALRTGSPAITFNPAGLGLYKFNHSQETLPDINSYVMIFDPLNLMQMLAQLVYADLTADGTVHYLKPSKDSPMREWHGIEGFLRLGGLNDMQRLADIK